FTPKSKASSTRYPVTNGESVAVSEVKYAIPSSTSLPSRSRDLGNEPGADHRGLGFVQVGTQGSRRRRGGGCIGVPRPFQPVRGSPALLVAPEQERAAAGA